jgi:hypothetical protein
MRPRVPRRTPPHSCRGAQRAAAAPSPRRRAKRAAPRAPRARCAPVSHATAHPTTQMRPPRTSGGATTRPPQMATTPAHLDPPSRVQTLALPLPRCLSLFPSAADSQHPQPTAAAARAAPSAPLPALGCLLASAVSCGPRRGRPPAPGRRAAPRPPRRRPAPAAAAPRPALARPPCSRPSSPPGRRAGVRKGPGPGARARASALCRSYCLLSPACPTRARGAGAAPGPAARARAPRARRGPRLTALLFLPLPLSLGVCASLRTNCAPPAPCSCSVCLGTARNLGPRPFLRVPAPANPIAAATGPAPAPRGRRRPGDPAARARARLAPAPPRRAPPPYPHATPDRPC